MRWRERIIGLWAWPCMSSLVTWCGVGEERLGRLGGEVLVVCTVRSGLVGFWGLKTNRLTEGLVIMMPLGAGGGGGYLRFG